MLTKERLDAFLSSSDVQLDIDVPGYNGQPVPVTLIKRRIGRLASLLYLTFCDTTANDEGECTYAYSAQPFYQVMVFSPQHKDVFVLDAADSHSSGPDLGPFIDELREWYAGYDKRSKTARTSAGRKLMTLYVNELHTKYSDAAVITEVRPDLAKSLERFCTRHDNDGSHMIQHESQFRAVPDLIYSMGPVFFRNDVYDAWGRPFSAFDVYYAHEDEDGYIATLYEELKKSYPENGFVFLSPARDPVMNQYAMFMQAWSCWNTHTLFHKYRSVLKALEGCGAKKVVVTFFETNGKEEVRTLPLTYFTIGIWDPFVNSDGDLTLFFWQPNCPKMDLSLLKSISYRGKVLYEDPAL